MIFKLDVRGAIVVAAAITGLVTLAAPARADQCDDIAKQLAAGIDGLKVNFKAANIIYLTHPAAKELSLGCRAQGQTYSNELYAKGGEFTELFTSQIEGVAGAADPAGPVENEQPADLGNPSDSSDSSNSEG